MGWVSVFKHGLVFAFPVNILANRMAKYAIAHDARSIEPRPCIVNGQGEIFGQRTMSDPPVLNSSNWPEDQVVFMFGSGGKSPSTT